MTTWSARIGDDDDAGTGERDEGRGDEADELHFCVFFFLSRLLCHLSLSVFEVRRRESSLKFV